MTMARHLFIQARHLFIYEGKTARDWRMPMARWVPRQVLGRV